MSPLDQLNEIRAAARRGLPPVFRNLVDMKVKRVTVTLNERTLCRAGRIVEHALWLWAEWTNTKVDDRTAELLGRALDAVGCER